jgi:hypothetical protein
MHTDEIEDNFVVSVFIRVDLWHFSSLNLNAARGRARFFAPWRLFVMPLSPRAQLVGLMKRSHAKAPRRKGFVGLIQTPG